MERNAKKREELKKQGVTPCVNAAKARPKPGKCRWTLKKEEEKPMTKSFISRIIREGSVDTREYRYTIDRQTGEIKRLHIKDLDTTAAINNWVTVKRL